MNEIVYFGHLKRMKRKIIYIYIHHFVTNVMTCDEMKNLKIK